MSGTKRDCACPRAGHQHGTWHAYANDRCRCEPCREAWATYTRDRRRRIAYASHRRWPLYVTPDGTARRLQALATLGWAPKELAVLLGTAECVVADWRRCRPEWVYGTTAARVAELYDELWDTPSPGRYALKVRRLAAREGWLPPMAFDDETIDDPAVHVAAPVDESSVDEVAVRRAMQGDKVPLTKPERAEAVRRLTAAGHSVTEIAARLGTYTRRVTRDRAKNREAAA